MPTVLDFRRPAMTAVLALTAGCAGVTGPHDGASAAPMLAALPRALTGAERSVILASNDFSLSLFRTVSGAAKDSNVFVSPLSASMALGMTMNGAAGSTYGQMRTALAFSDASQSEINAGYKGMIALLRDLDPAVQLGVANSVWHRQSYPFHQSFLDAASNWFDATVTALNFNDPSAVATINGWVDDATHGRIHSIIEQIQPDDEMFLINAIYFKGSWRNRFDPAQTGDAPFHGATGDQTVALMHRVGTIRYFANEDLQAVDLPYGNGTFNMTVLLPRQGKSVDAVAASLPANRSLFSTDQFSDLEVDLSLPRFKLEWQRTLDDDLKTLGIVDAFKRGVADFTPMSPLGRELYVAFVKQKTFVAVNEEGTEAAAVTAVGVRATSYTPPPVVRVDRPFVFVIRERLSGTILFIGKIVRLP